MIRLFRKKKKEYILCAAIWYKEIVIKDETPLRLRGFSPYNIDKGIVLCGWRHSNIITQLFSLTEQSTKENAIQGFLTNKNRFVDREEGAAIAFNAKQIRKKKVKLYSEDLY